MKNQKTSIYSIVKHISYELLTEELFQFKTDASSRLIEKYNRTGKSLKLKELSQKIINSIILLVQPIFLLVAYLDINSSLRQVNNFQIIIFINSVNFQFFFVAQFFNFLLMGLFNLIDIMDGSIYDYIKTLPLSRKEMNKLVLYTIYHKINFPIFTTIISVPVILLIVTQNFLAFFISLGVSIMNLVFFLSILIILGEKIARLMKRNKLNSRKPLFVQLINSFSYVLIIFGGIFLIEIFLNFLVPFLLTATDLIYIPLYNISLFLIPFPFNVSYLVSISIVMPEMLVFFWLNLLYGFVLYLLTLYYLIRRSLKSLDAVVSSKNVIKKDKFEATGDLGTIKIQAKSQFKAFIRKDFLTASRDLQTAMYFIMPVIMSITFIFFFNINLILDNISLNYGFLINNWIIILAFNPILSAIIVNNILNIDTPGRIIINILPVNRREQAKSKLFTIILIQILAVIIPSIIFIFHNRFTEILLTFICTIPFILIFSFTTFLLRIKLFGRKKQNYILFENWPENKMSKWSAILLTNYIMYFFFIFFFNYLSIFFNISLLLLNEFFLCFLLVFFLKITFDRFFPKKSKSRWSSFLIYVLSYCFICYQILLLDSIIPYSIGYTIPIILVVLPIGILLIKKVIKPKMKLKKKKVRKKKPKISKKKEEFNWIFIILIVAILFFIYTLLPINARTNPLLIILEGIYLILIGFALLAKLLRSVKIKSKKSPIESKYYFQIDFLKALMIFLVIFDHTIPWTIKNELGVALWERIAIPVFLVIMGFNFGNSYKNRPRDTLKAQYFRRKLSRYLIPFIIIYIISTRIGIYFYGNNLEVMLMGQNAPFDYVHLNIFIFPFWGPGNWFIPVLFSSIIILPIIFKGFSGKRFWAIITLSLCFLIEASLQFYIYSQMKPYTESTIVITYFIICNSLFYASALGLGMWFSINHKIYSRHNLFMWIIFPLSLIYLILYQFFNFRFVDSNGIAYLTGDYNYLVIPYSAFLVLLAIKILPKKKNGIAARIFSTIGKATYHIFLAQILYFAILIAMYGDHYGVSIIGVATDNLNIFINLIINWSICIPIGIIWWSIENSIRDFYQSKKGLIINKKRLSFHNKETNGKENLERFQLFKKTHVYICSNCKEFFHTYREYCENCGEKDVIHYATEEDYEIKKSLTFF